MERFTDILGKKLFKIPTPVAEGKHFCMNAFVALHSYSM